MKCSMSPAPPLIFLLSLSTGALYLSTPEPRDEGMGGETFEGRSQGDACCVKTPPNQSPCTTHILQSQGLICALPTFSCGSGQSRNTTRFG